jgi:hypothetical protein
LYQFKRNSYLQVVEMSLVEAMARVSMEERRVVKQILTVRLGKRTYSTTRTWVKQTSHVLKFCEILESRSNCPFPGVACSRLLSTAYSMANTNTVDSTTTSSDDDGTTVSTKFCRVVITFNWFTSIQYDALRSKRSNELKPLRKTQIMETCFVDCR